MASPETPIDIEQKMADDRRAQQFRREHPELFVKNAKLFQVGDHVRRRNGVKVRVVKYIRDGRLYLQSPGKTWFDWENADHAILVRRAEDVVEPTDLMVWAVCPYCRNYEDCKRCPEWEIDNDYGRVKRGCRMCAEEACRVVLAAKGKDLAAESQADERDGAVASACERVATSNSPLPDAPKQEQ